ncbi:MAG TPA: TonB-dependent receptor plug domain-containing protein, partial [Puia sp.]|nr:TonB-dependent receptor plug domain-containing protein [Puia sp.]
MLSGLYIFKSAAGQSIRISAIFLTGIFIQWSDLYAQKHDSSALLHKIIISAEKKPAGFKAPVAEQSLSREFLENLNTESVGDAAKYFSGVLIKDYGGTGGLKTISTRSLGAFNTSILYDGITVADAQTGQIDLSKFSSTFVQSLQLDQANPQQLPLPARAYSSASVLSIFSSAFNTANFSQDKWQMGLKQGSFGLWHAFAGLYFPFSGSLVASANLEATESRGNYPYTVNNGMFSEELRRANSDLRSFLGEFNIVKRFDDSSQLQMKCWSYNSERGLPGSTIFFNNNSAQRLADNDIFFQSRFHKKLGIATELLVSLKFSSTITGYRDPDFLNNSGGLNDHYYQNEEYTSLAISHGFGANFKASIASDFAVTHLNANIQNFATPTRYSFWNNIAAEYAEKHWQFNASLLNSTFVDHAANETGTINRNQLTPGLAVAYKPASSGPWLFRAFYKFIYRLPTFNDLYYTYTTSVNAKLQPENTWQYDVGIVYNNHFNRQLEQLSLSTDVYYNSVRDKIVSVPSVNLFQWTVLNLGRVSIKGIDVAA